MSPESASRQEILDQISSFENTARRKALRLLPIYLPLSLISTSKGSQFLAKKLAPLKHQFHEANDRLRTFEVEEGFPTVREYIGAIQKITSHLPQKAKDLAYYPFAGFDIFWASVFRNVAMEDRNYNVGQDKYDLWWSPEDYDTQKLSDFVDQIKENGLIPIHHQVDFVNNDSENGRNFARFNNPETSLIYKGGHTFLTYARAMSKRGLFAFGAIILSGDDPKIPVVKVDGFLKEQNYQLVHNSWGRESKYGSPWAIEIINPRVYIKR